MKTHAPSLGDQIARLHGTVLAQEKCAWIPAPIHTLIIAVLACIFTRLEALLHLWQSGTLPLPTPLAAPRPQHSARHPSPHPTSIRAHRRTRTAGPRPESISGPPSRTPATTHAANPTQAGTLTPRHTRPPVIIFYKPPWPLHPSTP